MLAFKSGDLVVLKSGGPVMTVDTVNTDIFDDDKITGLLCVWFVGDRMERVRFDHRAVDKIEPPSIAPQAMPAQAAGQQVTAPQMSASPRDASVESSGEYKTVLDNMVGALNVPSEPPAERPAPRRRKPAARRTALAGDAPHLKN